MTNYLWVSTITRSDLQVVIINKHPITQDDPTLFKSDEKTKIRNHSIKYFGVDSLLNVY